MKTPLFSLTLKNLHLLLFQLLSPKAAAHPGMIP
jgi:hypothetical protein